MSTAFRISHAERNFLAAFRQHRPAAAADNADASPDVFKALFASVLRECSQAHVQACSEWVIDYVLPTPALVDAFGGFLTSVSAAYSSEKQRKDGMAKADIKAKLWPLIFVVNEMLHTTKYHLSDRRHYDECTAMLRLPVINLVKDLAQFPRRTSQKHFNRLLALLAYWHKQSYFDKAYNESLKTLVESEGQQLPAEAKDFALAKQKRSQAESDAPRKREKTDPTKGIQILGGIDNVDEDGSWKLPEFHGGPKTPWHLLPAATWLMPLQHADHEAGRGMRKRHIHPIKFNGVTVSKQARKEVLKLLKEADELYNPIPDSGKRIEYDQMGRKMEVIKVRKGTDGKIKKYVRYETYYGWSPKFLDEMYRNPGTGSLAEMRKRHSRSSTSSSRSRKSSTPRSRGSRFSPQRGSHNQQYSNSVSYGWQGPTSQSTRQPPLAPNTHANFSYPPPPVPPPWIQGQQSPFPPVPAGYNGPWPPPPPPLPPHFQYHHGSSSSPPPPFPSTMEQNGWNQAGGPPPPPHPPPPMPQQQGQSLGSGYNSSSRGNYGGGYIGGYGQRGRREGYGGGGY